MLGVAARSQTTSAPWVHSTGNTGELILSGAAGVRDASALEPAIKLSGSHFIVARRELTAIDVYNARHELIARLPRRSESVTAIPRAALAVAHPDTLLLLDRRHQRLVWYRLYSSKPPELIEITRLVRNYSDMCVFHHRVLLLGADTATTIDAFTRRSRSLTHNWLVAGPKRPAVERALNDARVVCAADGNLFFIVGLMNRSVSAYGEDGRLIWSRQLVGLRNAVILRDPPGSFGISSPPGGYHVLSRALLMGRGLLVQFTLAGVERPRWGKDGPVLSILLDHANGREIARSNSLPQVVAATGSEAWAFSERDGRLVSWTQRDGALDAP